MTTLLPCPFCGGEPRATPSGPPRVDCTYCGASMELQSAQDSERAWNRRSSLMAGPLAEAERHDRMTFAAVFRKAREVIIYIDGPTTADGSSVTLPAEARTRLLALLVDGEPELATSARAFREAFAGGEDAHTTEQWAALERLNRALGDPA